MKNTLKRTLFFLQGSLLSPMASTFRSHPAYPVLLFLLTMAACKAVLVRNSYKDANQLIHQPGNLKAKPFLKAHLKNGEVGILFDSWIVDTVSRKMTGTGQRYNVKRVLVHSGPLEFSFDSIALYETNTKIDDNQTGQIAALGLVAGMDVALGIYCITNPKACFGSCPTFYLNENDPFHFADAEGFSNAIAPSLEYGDIDALNNPKTTGRDFQLTMKNEALETHCIKDIRLLAVPRNPGERIYQSRKNEIFRCAGEMVPTQAFGPEGNVTALVQHQDRVERFSKADPHHMMQKEEVLLEFDDIPANQSLGLVVSFRQTLMTTFFIYNAIAYMGDEASDIFARMEREEGLGDSFGNGLKNALGDLDVQFWNEETRQWEKQGGFYETGPIAMNRQILPLTRSIKRSKIKMKLVMNKGLWRIDGVALTRILEKVTPKELEPIRIENKKKEDPAALSQLRSPDKHLISMPGDQFTLHFRLPGDQDHELFLYSKGYYLEWLRANWLKDKNLYRLYQMVHMPETYLKQQAKAYSEYEKTMEQEFWNSRIDTKTFTLHEN